MKRILLGLSLIAAVAAVVVGATTAFYGDTETSTGNVLAAGAIDLAIDNTSYYNGVFNPGTSWQLDWDLDPETNPDGLPRLFFNFDDLKPGDWGEDTISLHVDDNASWLCADVTLVEDLDNTSTEPELDDGDTDVSLDPDGELASHVRWYWWADDGDNVYEDDESLLPGSGGNFGSLGVDNPAYITLADASYNVWNPSGGPLPEDSPTVYLGKAWCFGDSPFAPYPSVDAAGTDNTSPEVRPVTCDGLNESNITQTDSMKVDITFRAEQSRNNPDFSCQPEQE